MRITKLLPTSRVARVAISLAVLASLVTISVIVAGATGGSAENPLARDAQDYAVQFGTTVDEAERRLNLQEAIGKLDHKLTTGESDTFAGLWIQHEPDFKVIVKFTEGGESTLRRYISGGDLEDLVEVGTAANTMASLRQAQTDAKSASDSIEVLTESGINVFENRAELYILDKDSFNSLLESEGLELPQNVSVKQVDEFSSQATSIYGGLEVSTSTGDCTTGFSVTDEVGTVGITTAEHCGDDVEYEGILLERETGSDGGSVDLQWLTSDEVTPNNIFFDGYNNKTVSGTLHRNYQSIGTHVCKYGDATERTCGQISDKDVRPVGSYFATWMRVHNPNESMGLEGDSGGPVFYGQTAYGTTSSVTRYYNSADEPTDIFDLVYMAVNYFSNLN